MSQLQRLLQTLAKNPLNRLRPPTDQPKFPAHLHIPPELTEFYSLCGGIDFFNTDEETGELRGRPDYSILPPTDLVTISLATCGEELPFEPLSFWYTIGVNDNGEHAVIDLDPFRLGQIYDVFHETFSDPTSASIIAPNLTAFIEQLAHHRKIYWLSQNFQTVYYG